MYNFSNKDYTYKKGDKVAQIKIEKIYDTTIEWADNVEEAQRGDAGFGSSGK
jgi:dUTP pyrophosphatase